MRGPWNPHPLWRSRAGLDGPAWLSGRETDPLHLGFQLGHGRGEPAGKPFLSLNPSQVPLLVDEGASSAVAAALRCSKAAHLLYLCPTATDHEFSAGPAGPKRKQWGFANATLATGPVASKRARGRIVPTADGGLQHRAGGGAPLLGEGLGVADCACTGHLAYPADLSSPSRSRRLPTRQAASRPPGRVRLQERLPG